MPQSPYGWFSLAVMFGCSVFGVAGGRGWVRACAAMLLLDVILFPFLRDPGQWTDPLKPRFIVDLAQLALFLAATAVTGNYRLGLLAAFTVLDVSTNFAKLPLRGMVGPFVYVVAVQVWDWGAYASMIWSVVDHPGFSLLARVEQSTLRTRA